MAISQSSASDGVASECEAREILQQIACRIDPSFPDKIRESARSIPADVLAEIASDNNGDYITRLAQIAIYGRVPDAWAKRFSDRAVNDPDDSNDALITALEASGEFTKTTIRTAIRRTGNTLAADGVPLDTLKNDILLNGDNDAFGVLNVLASSDWYRSRDEGMAAQQQIIEQIGQQRVLEILKADSLEQLAFNSKYAADRLFGVRLLHANRGPILTALGDPDPNNSWYAYQLLTVGDRNSPIRTGSTTNATNIGSFGPTNQELRRLATSDEPGRLWAIAILLFRGQDISDLPIDFDSIKIPLPNVPKALRAAIVDFFVPDAEPGTDPRWLIEAARGNSLAPKHEALLRRLAKSWMGQAVRELTKVGVDPETPVSAGKHEGSGDGTFDVISTSVGTVAVSNLAPYFDFWYTIPDDETRQLISSAMANANIQPISKELGATVFEGLNVYFFGDQKPLPIRDLILYWQS
ncbi:MAG: hypothetical protein FWG25_01250 [Promicromonosporaceae bacterium]|nr:hypothetical protein [Promicromonosporaceae bacterium]